MELELGMLSQKTMNTLLRCKEVFTWILNIPSSSMIVTVEVAGVPACVPDGGTKLTVKVSFPSKATASVVIVKLTQATVLSSENVTISVSSTKSSPLKKHVTGEGQKI